MRGTYRVSDQYRHLNDDADDAMGARLNAMFAEAIAPEPTGQVVSLG